MERSRASAIAKGSSECDTALRAEDGFRLALQVVDEIPQAFRRRCEALEPARRQLDDFEDHVTALVGGMSEAYLGREACEGMPLGIARRNDDVRGRAVGQGCLDRPMTGILGLSRCDIVLER